MPLSSPTKILLTGGTSGIGAVMRQMLIRDGHEVLVIARTASHLPFHDRLRCFDCDLTDRKKVATLVRHIAGEHPDIGVLVNNAALQYDVPLTDPGFDPAKMIEEVDINLVAPALVTHYFVKHAQLRAIVNISSGLAFFPKQQSALYCATKAAIHSFSTSLRYQLEAHRIQVSEVILPLVDTPMTAGRGSSKISAEAAALAILSGVKKRRSEIYIGKARLIPFFVRFAPAIGRKILRAA